MRFTNYPVLLFINVGPRNVIKIKDVKIYAERFQTYNLHVNISEIRTPLFKLN